MWIINSKLLAVTLILVSGQVLETKSKKVSGKSNFLRDFYNGGQPLNFEYYLHSFELSDDYWKLLESNNVAIKFQKEWENIMKNSSRDASDMACFIQMAQLVAGVANKDLTSLKYFDSWGKIPAGILKGNRMELGNFDECLDINKVLMDQSQLIGKYCFAKVPIGKYLTQSDLGSIFTIDIAVCLPKVCTAAQFDIFLREFWKKILNNNLIDQMNGTSLVSDSSCRLKEKPPFGALQWITLSILIILGVAMILSTSYDYYTKSKGKPANPIMKSFSVVTNMEQLLRIVPNEKSPNAIHCLNGIRCFSLLWVVIGHSFMFAIMSPIINIVDIFPWSKTAYSMLFQYAYYSVDTFFFLSGLLVSYIALRDMERNNGKLNIVMMYVHRLLRLTPMVALAILVYTAFFNYMGNGPLWTRFSDVSGPCKEKWWSTILYVQNYVNGEAMCLPHTWYLAIDTQLYILSPIFLIALWKWGRKAAVGIAVFGLLLAGCLFATIMVNDLSFHFMGLMVSVGDSMVKTYFATHLRASPWIIGLILGYFMFTRRGKRSRFPKLVVLIGWLASLALLATVLFSFYPNLQTGDTAVSTLEEAFYWTLGRIAWPLGLSWIVFACANGYGGIINDFLAAPLWQPLSRLSYCMYLWHIFIECFNAGRTKTTLKFSNYDGTLSFWSDFGWTLLLSVAMYLAFEAPLVHIENALLRKPQKKPLDNTSSEKNLVEPAIRVSVETQ